MKINYLKVLIGTSLLLTAGISLTSCNKDKPVDTVVNNVYQNVESTSTVVEVKLLADDISKISKAFLYYTKDGEQHSKEMKHETEDDCFKTNFEKPIYEEDNYELSEVYIIYIDSGGVSQNKVELDNIWVTSITGLSNVVGDENNKKYINITLKTEGSKDEEGKYYEKIIAYDENNVEYDYTGSLFINGTFIETVDTTKESVLIDLDQEALDFSNKNVIMLSNFELVSDNYKSGTTQSLQYEIDSVTLINSCELTVQNTEICVIDTGANISLDFVYNKQILTPSYLTVNGKDYKMEVTNVKGNALKASLCIPTSDLSEGINDLNIQEVKFKNMWELPVKKSVQISLKPVRFNIEDSMNGYCLKKDIENGLIPIYLTIDNPEHYMIKSLLIDDEKVSVNSDLEKITVLYNKKVNEESSQIELSVNSVFFEQGTKEFEFILQKVIFLQMKDINPEFYTLPNAVSYNDSKYFALKFENANFDDIKIFKVDSNKKSYIDNIIFDKESGYAYIPIYDDKNDVCDYLSKDDYDNYELTINGVEYYINNDLIATLTNSTGYSFRTRFDSDIFTYFLPIVAVEHQTYYIEDEQITTNQSQIYILFETVDDIELDVNQEVILWVKDIMGTNKQVSTKAIKIDGTNFYYVYVSNQEIKTTSQYSIIFGSGEFTVDGLTQGLSINFSAGTNTPEEFTVNYIPTESGSYSKPEGLTAYQKYIVSIINKYVKVD